MSYSGLDGYTGIGRLSAVVCEEESTSTHSFTHMYLENETLSHLNHTSCERCCIIARRPVLYPWIPDTNTGKPFGYSKPRRRRRDAKARSNLARTTEKGPMYLCTRGTVTRLKRRGVVVVDVVERDEMSFAAPRGRDMWFGCEDMPI